MTGVVPEGKVRGAAITDDSAALLASRMRTVAGTAELVMYRRLCLLSSAIKFEGDAVCEPGTDGWSVNVSITQTIPV